MQVVQPPWRWRWRILGPKSSHVAHGNDRGNSPALAQLPVRFQNSWMNVQPVGEVVPIGQRIQARLDELDKSAAWLAEMVGVPRSTITRAVKGERNPTPETLQEIAPVLGVTLAQLVTGTDAAERVEDAQNLVSRRDYEGAVRQVIEYERKANDLHVQVRDLTESAERELERARRAREELDAYQQRFASMVEERDQARRQARQDEADARRYRQALEKAVTDVALLQEQVRELGAAVEDGKMTSRLGAILAGVAAAVSVASYLGSDSDDSKTTKEEGATSGSRSRKRRPRPS